MPEEKDFYIMMNDHKQGFMMYQRTPIARVGYQSDKLVCKPGWYYGITEFDAIKTYDKIEDIFGEIFRLLESYTFNNFSSAFYHTFSPYYVPNGYDRITCINGKAEWTRMPPTVWVGSEIYEQIGNDVEYARRTLASDVKRMLKDDIASLEKLVREVSEAMNDFQVNRTQHRNYQAINDRIAKDIANIYDSIMDMKY